ncbi:hypothetical protein THRCLA_22328 [Thraustotheca clavata]|uniref:Uncharacterized protein n=1 Tax=Thraustotheca clavata TaxID=74557 RepID=A0A1V9Z5G2_9STRA|nr:hypothetical protein THRCLA_22328 [Thraustotheca clavata]
MLVDSIGGKQTVVDQPDFAFVGSPMQNELRDMLVSLQALPHDRLDIVFDGILCHERIIAKRPNSYKPSASGVDVVHHVADTFLFSLDADKKALENSFDRAALVLTDRRYPVFASASAVAKS